MQPLSQHQTLFFRMPQGTHYKSPQAMQRGGSQAQTTYFRTQQAQQVVTRQEEALRERETLTYAPALTKLKLEADKIRKWKTATQFELKKKESQLREVREHLRVQQEMVTGMRVREEALKTRLQDEVASYTDLQHRILVTRGMCSTLKEKLEHSEAALSQGRADQNDNVDLDNLRMEQYRALARKFKELEQEQGEVQRSLKEALTAEREKGHGLSQELTNERERSERLCAENVTLQEQLAAIRTEEMCVRGRLEKAESRAGEEEGGRERAEEQCRQLRQQLTTSQEHTHGLEATITSLNGEMSSLRSEYSQAQSSLQQELAESAEQCSELQARLQQCLLTLDTQQAELACAGREKENMETALTSLREELCAMEYSRQDDVAGLKAQMREREKTHAQEMAASENSLASFQTSLTALQAQLRESEASCAAKARTVTELSHSLEEKEAVSTGLQTEVRSLQECVAELRREGEEWRGEREREKGEAQATIHSLTTELETLRSEFDDQRRAQGERGLQLECEKEEVVKELLVVRQQLEQMVEERERQQRAAEALQEEVRSQCASEVQRCRQEAEKAQETQLREKESFDTQVTELCGMLEKYRTENQKIVQQKDLQIHSLQSSLADTSQAKDSLEEMVRGAQEEVLRLGEEAGQLQQAMREREEEAKEREARVREREEEAKEREARVREREEEAKEREARVREREEEAKEREARVREREEEMAELLKAVDTLRNKQQSGLCTPQSTSHTVPKSTPLHSLIPPSHSSPLAHLARSPQTPQVPIVSSMAPLTAPVHNTLHSLRHQRSSGSEGGHRARSLPTSRVRAPPTTYATPTRPLRPAVKKPRCEEGDTEEGVVRYKQTDPEDVLFRKPRSLSAVRSHLRHSALSSQQRESKAHQSRQGAPHIPPPTPPKPPCAGGDDSYLVDTSTVSEVTSTCRVTSDKKVKSASARARGGRGHKSGGTRERKGAGGRGKERKQAGTAWFDLDAVFGFGPED